jgi:hypothetical protein
MRSIDDQIKLNTNNVYNLDKGDLDFDTFLNLYSTPLNNLEKV